MDIKQWGQDVQAKVEELTPLFPNGFCMVMSLSNRERNTTPGKVCEVSVRSAARGIVENTHRLATPQEVVVFQDNCDEAKRIIAQAELNRPGNGQAPLMALVQGLLDRTPSAPVAAPYQSFKPQPQAATIRPSVVVDNSAGDKETPFLLPSTR